ncbi:hypothetical protein Verru16b_01795 [Lacunisphaera limnophila]|uniref:Uncharacterized protein n=1 Tax=Lacunisphaera limnophila TaxID=1838286 RepID=A0A1D8AUZ9_9BACT|nr:hypothetical protein Verru16b_01795 [Lacunisphaera limnophila]
MYGSDPRLHDRGPPGKNSPHHAPFPLSLPDPLLTIGFEPQTSGQPLVNVHKRTTKVNISMAIAVAVFLLIGLGGIIWAVRREDQAERTAAPVGTGS